MKKKKGRLSTILLVVAFLAGLSLLLYPTVADYWNSFHSSRAIAEYSDAVNKLTEEEYAAILAEAEQYNREIALRPKHAMSDSDMERYNSLLNFTGSGIMGKIEIPAIDVDLPIYHTTKDSVLQVGVGHVEWSSLPVGGETSHCVLSGHRGLPSARLFTDLDRLIVGDIFTLHVLNEVLTYEVDQILIVLPNEVSALELVSGKDYCTLVTCTPYGINTHRLLVRGHRIENMAQASESHIIAEAIQVEPAIVATVVGIPILLLIMLFVLFSGGRKQKGSKRGGKNR